MDLTLLETQERLGYPGSFVFPAPSPVETSLQEERRKKNSNEVYAAISIFFTTRAESEGQSCATLDAAPRAGAPRVLP